MNTPAKSLSKNSRGSKGSKGSEGTKRTEGPGGGGRVERVAAPPLALTLYWRGDRLERLELGRIEGKDGAPELPVAASPEAHAVHKALTRLAAGQDAEFPNLPLRWDALPAFTALVLRTLFEQVPSGRTVTYAELAAMAGQPGKARAVGQAMARNPWPLVVPCHRVLGAGGALTGYTNPHGLDLKALLLALESGQGRGQSARG